MKPRVLLVDDDPDMANLMSRLLSLDGYEVCIAGSVADALKQAQSQTFDVLVSDIQLPDGDGPQLMTKLRETCASLPGVIVSGHGDDHDIDRTRAAGFCAHLVKPVTVEAICAAISRAMRPPPHPEMRN